MWVNFAKFTDCHENYIKSCCCPEIQSFWQSFVCFHVSLQTFKNLPTYDRVGQLVRQTNCHRLRLSLFMKEDHSVMIVNFQRIVRQYV